MTETKARQTKVVPRLCPFCEQNCGVLVEVDEAARKIISVRGDKDDPFSKGYICPKAHGAKALQDDADVIRGPMIRRDGVFHPASWDEALDYAALRISAIKEAHGPNAVALYFGNPVAHIPGPIFSLPNLLLTLGTTQIYSATSVDHTPQLLAMLALYGSYASFPVPDIDRTDYLVLVGTNPYASNGSLMTAPGVPRRLEALRERGGKLVVVDPRRTETAKKSDWHLPIRPEGDAWLMLGILHTLFAEGLVDIGAAEGRLKGLAELRALVADHSPKDVAEHCGLEADEIRRLALELAAAPSGCIYGRVGTTLQSFGSITHWLIQCINILTGNLDRTGGLMFPDGVFAQILGAEKIKDGQVPYGRWRSRVSCAPEVASQLPTAVLAEEIETPGDGQVRALITVCGNPSLSCQNEGGRLDRAMDSLDFMLSFDIYLNETTRHADVILPSPDHMTHSDFPIYFVPFMVRHYIKWCAPAFAAGKDEWQDSDIYTGLTARLLGISPDECAERSMGILFEQLRGIDNPVLRNLTLDQVIDKLQGDTLQDRMFDLLVRSGAHGDHFGARPEGLTLQKIQAHPHGLDLGPMLPGELSKHLHHEDGLIDLFPPLIAPDIDRLLTHDPIGGLQLVGRRNVRSNNTWMHNLGFLAKGPDRTTLLIHPQDAAERGIADGARVAVTSAIATVEATAELCGDMRRGVISLPHGWGHDAPGSKMSVASERPGTNINALSDSARIDAPTWNAAFNGLRVETVPLMRPDCARSDSGLASVNG